MSDKWNEFITTPSKKFGYQVPTYTPSIYREYRGEIFTTFHSGEHPVMTKIGEGNQIHGRFSKSYKGVLRGLHYDNKTWKLETNLKKSLKSLLNSLMLICLFKTLS